MQRTKVIDRLNGFKEVEEGSGFLPRNSLYSKRSWLFSSIETDINE
jgi:hypothetical protein